jgi:hypothetical protein
VDDLVAFLRARIDDDTVDQLFRHRSVMRGIEAKRRIINWVEGAQASAGEPPGFDPDDAATLTHALRLLALPYDTHPDYRAEWAPGG